MVSQLQLYKALGSIHLLEVTSFVAETAEDDMSVLLLAA